MTDAGRRLARIATDVRILQWLVGAVLVVALAGFGVLFWLLG